MDNSLSYGPQDTKWRLYCSDITRQVMLALIANLMILNIKPVIYIIAQAKLDWIVYFWIGSDYQTTFKHFLRQIKARKNPIHFLVIIGILVTILVSIAPSLLVLLAPASINSIGGPIGSAPISASRSALLSVNINSPHAEMSRLFKERRLDPALAYSINTNVYTVSSNVAIDTSETTTALGLVLNLTQEIGSGTTEGTLTNAGNSNGSYEALSFGNEMYLAISNADGELLQAASYRGNSTNGSRRGIKPVTGDDLVIFSRRQITFLQFQSAQTVSSERVAISRYGSSTSWKIWAKLVQNNNATVPGIALASNVNTTTGPEGYRATCRMQEAVQNFTLADCTVTLSPSPNQVTFATVKFLPDPDRQLSTFYFTSFTYNVTTLTPKSSTPVLQPFLKSDTDAAGVFSTVWFSVPGRQRKDAYSLVLASILAVDFSSMQSLVADGFYATNRYQQYDATYLFIFLISLVFSTLIILGTRSALNRRAKRKNVKFIVEYDLVVESLSKRGKYDLVVDGTSTIARKRKSAASGVSGVSRASDATLPINSPVADAEELRVLDSNAGRGYGSGGGGGVDGAH
ncbi:hypothetical protein BJ741DRAFT_660504 [Chytriomyces cf. hyalinus JEL632]|nr:hypothetical protein BJ741DRAFT_660504 [Chytriomyces cf. hyalinus JEL632]